MKNIANAHAAFDVRFAVERVGKRCAVVNGEAQQTVFGGRNIFRFDAAPKGFQGEFVHDGLIAATTTPRGVPAWSAPGRRPPRLAAFFRDLVAPRD